MGTGVADMDGSRAGVTDMDGAGVVAMDVCGWYCWEWGI